LPSLLSPDQEAQERALKQAQAGHAVQLLHVHGIGQPMADTTELLAFQSVWRSGGTLLNHKANLGHTVAAAGALAVLTTLEALRQGGVPAHLKLERPVRQLEGKLVAPVQLIRVVAEVAGVHGHAISGVNVHLVLQGVECEGSLMEVKRVQWKHEEVLPAPKLTVETAPKPLASQIGPEHFTDPSLRQAAEEWLLGEVRQLLDGVATAQDDLWELGLKSQQAVRLKARLEEASQQAVPVDLLFKQRTAGDILDAMFTAKLVEDPTIWLRPAPRQVDDRLIPLWSRPLWSLLVFAIVSSVSGWALTPVLALDDLLNDRTLAPYERLTTWRLLVLLPLYHLVFCMATAVAALLIKWICVGCYHPGAHAISPPHPSHLRDRRSPHLELAVLPAAPGGAHSGVV
jgi:hypothetical protein